MKHLKKLKFEQLQNKYRLGLLDALLDVLDTSSTHSKAVHSRPTVLGYWVLVLLFCLNGCGYLVPIEQASNPPPPSASPQGDTELTELHRHGDQPPHRHPRTTPSSDQHTASGHLNTDTTGRVNIAQAAAANAEQRQHNGANNTNRINIAQAAANNAKQQREHAQLNAHTQPQSNAALGPNGSVSRHSSRGSFAADLPPDVLPPAPTAFNWQNRVLKHLNQPDRSSSDKAKDLSRHPIKIMEFMQIRPGMTVLDVGSGTGYNAELFSIAVGDSGRVYVHNNQRTMSIENGFFKRSLRERFGDDHSNNKNIEIWVTEIDELKIPDNSVDIAFWGLNFHDYYHREGKGYAIKILREIKRALKPGGRLTITDHLGLPDRNNEQLHRITLMELVNVINSSGFIIEGQSELLSNSNDSHTLNVFDENIYQKTDRVLLNLKKSDQST